MILKIHTADGHAVFTDIGKEYQVIKRDFPGFKDCMETHFGKQPEDQPLKVFAFLTYSGGINVLPLYEGTHYYIFSEGGRLFDTLTFR